MFDGMCTKYGQVCCTGWQSRDWVHCSLEHSCLPYTDFDTLVTVKAIPNDIAPMEVSEPIEFEVDADKILNGVLRVNLDIDDCGDGNNWILTDQAGCTE